MIYKMRGIVVFLLLFSLVASCLFSVVLAVLYFNETEATKKASIVHEGDLRAIESIGDEIISRNEADERAVSSIVTILENYRDNFPKTKSYSLHRQVTNKMIDYVKSAPDVNSAVGYLKYMPVSKNQSEVILAVMDYLDNQKLSYYDTLFDWMAYPVATKDGVSPADNFYITDKFGRRLNPKKTINSGYGGSSLKYTDHNAIDFSNVNNNGVTYDGKKIDRRKIDIGDAVAMSDGVVLGVYKTPDFNWFVEIKHEMHPDLVAYCLKNYGSKPEYWTTLYAHFDSKPKLKMGDLIKKGDFISKIGNSGVSTGPHLHVEMRIYGSFGVQTSNNGKKFNGINFLVKK